MQPIKSLFINSKWLHPDQPIKKESLGTEGARQRFLVNLLSNMVIVLAQVAINFWMTPFLIGHLGVAAYGMVPLANSLIIYASVLTTALNTALSRFLTIDLKKQEVSNANITFNTALFALLGLIVILIPVAVIVSIYFPSLFKVPTGWEMDVSWLTLAIAASFFVTVIASNFAVSTFMHSQFLVSNLINLAGLVIEFGFIILTFSFAQAHLWYVGMGALVGALISLLGFIWSWRKLTPELHIHAASFDPSRLYLLGGMGGWVILNMLGAMLLSRMDLIVVNIFFGAVVLGGYAAVAQLAIFLDTISTSICTIIRPIFLIKFAQGDIEGLRNVAFKSIKLLGLSMALIVGLLCGFSRPLLTIWLGKSFQPLNILLIILIAHFSVNLAFRPLLHVQQAYNKVRGPGIVTLVSGVAAVILAVLAAAWGKWGFLGVAAAGALIWTFRNSIYTPIYTAHIMGLHWWAFYPSLKTVIAATAIVGAVSYAFTLIIMPESLLSLFIEVVCISIIYASIIWWIVLNIDERRLLRELTPF